MRISINKIIQYITSNSSQRGGNFGEMYNVPTIKEKEKIYTRGCIKDNCSGNRILFEHYVDLSAGTRKYSKESKYHIEDDILSSEFRIHGHICPICDNCEIRLDNTNIKNKIIHENEGIEF